MARRVLSDSQNTNIDAAKYPYMNDFLACAGLPVSQHRTLERHKDALEKPGAFILALLVLMPFSLLQADQSIQIVALTNGADFQLGLPQKGSLASIFCTGLQGSLGVVTAPPQYPLPTEIVSGGLSISVSINFTPAPILAIAFEQGYQQLNVQVPWEAPEEPLFVRVFQGSNSAYLVDPNPWGRFAFRQSRHLQMERVFRRFTRLCDCPARVELFPGNGANPGRSGRIPGGVRNQSGSCG